MGSLHDISDCRRFHSAISQCPLRQALIKLVSEAQGGLGPKRVASAELPSLPSTSRTDWEVLLDLNMPGAYGFFPGLVLLCAVSIRRYRSGDFCPGELPVVASARGISVPVASFPQVVFTRRHFRARYAGWLEGLAVKLAGRRAKRGVDVRAGNKNHSVDQLASLTPQNNFAC